MSITRKFSRRLFSIPEQRKGAGVLPRLCPSAPPFQTVGNCSHPSLRDRMGRLCPHVHPGFIRLSFYFWRTELVSTQIWSLCGVIGGGYYSAVCRITCTSHRLNCFQVHLLPARPGQIRIASYPLQWPSDDRPGEDSSLVLCPLDTHTAPQTGSC